MSCANEDTADTVDTVHITVSGSVKAESIRIVNGDMHRRFPDARRIIVEFTEAAFLDDPSVPHLVDWFHEISEEGLCMQFICPPSRIFDTFCRFRLLEVLPVFFDFEEMHLAKRATWHAVYEDIRSDY